MTELETKKLMYVLQRLQEDDDEKLYKFRGLHESIVTRIVEASQLGYAKFVNDRWHITATGRKTLKTYLASKKEK